MFQVHVEFFIPESFRGKEIVKYNLKIPDQAYGVTLFGSVSFSTDDFKNKTEVFRENCSCIGFYDRIGNYLKTYLILENPQTFPEFLQTKMIRNRSFRLFPK